VQREITVWDVQHGNATHIKTPNDRHIAVDLGAGKQFSPLRALYQSGLRHLDVVAITHPHRDHMDEISDLNLLPALSFLTPWHLSETAIRLGNRADDADVVKRYLETRAGCTFPVVAPNNLTEPSNFGGASFQIFTPQLCDDSNLNNHSLVVVVSYARLKMVIPGDNESPSWNELLLKPDFVAAVKGADVLLAAHHGRVAGYCPELFEAMGKPKLVVVSDGRFGDTSATGRYSAQATGWKVFDSEGQKDDRKCLTTRCDGHITIKLGWNANGPAGGNFLNVTTSKVNKNSLSSLVKSILGEE